MMKMIKCPFLSFPSPFIPNCFYMKKNLFHQYYAILVILSYKKTKQHWDDNVSYMNKTEKWFYYVNLHLWFLFDFIETEASFKTELFFKHERRLLKINEISSFVSILNSIPLTACFISIAS